MKFFLIVFFLLFEFIGFGQSNISRSIIDSSKNMIQNIQRDSNWMVFAQKIHRLTSGKQGQITIAHIGDSHIQGGVFTNRIRTLLNNQYGVVGRGLVFPYSLIYVNGPDDVKYYSSSKWVGQKYNLNTKDDKTSISGYNLWLKDTCVDLSLALRQGSDTLFPFNEVILYHNTPSLKVGCSKSYQKTRHKVDHNFYATKIIFNTLYDSVQLHMSMPDTMTHRLALYGIELVNNRPGIIYHSVGSNGTTYEAFLKSINYLPMLKELHPDCIIISLGTNDSYKRPVDTLMLKKRIISVIDSIKKELPGTCIMLTTPGDHLIEKIEANPNLIKTHDAILNAAREKKCVFWDFFEVMGGLYSSKRWDSHGLMYKDKLHLNREGYKLQGELFFEALQRALTN